MKSNIISFIKKHWGILVLFAAGLISLTWFGGKDYIYGDDTTLFVSLKKYSLLDEYFSIWSYKFPYYGISTLHFPFLMPFGFILKIIQLINLPFSGSIFQRFLIYYVLIASGLSMYTLFSLLFKSVSQAAKTVASLTYMFNFYIMLLWNPLPFNIFIYAFFPLLFALYVTWSSEGKPIYYAVVLALISLITITPGFMHLPFGSIYIGLLLGYFFLKLFLSNWMERKRLVIFSLFFVLTWLFLNFFWILPPIYFFRDQIATSTRPGYGTEMAGLYKFSVVPIKDAFFFQGNAIFNTLVYNSRAFPYADVYQKNSFKILALLVPLVAFIGFFIKKNRETIYLLMVVIFSLLLASSETIPFIGKVISETFIKFKLVYIYRSVYHRFIPIYVFAIIIFFGLGWEKIYKLKLPRYVNIIKNITLLFLSFLTIFVYVFPFWTGRLHETEGMTPSKQITFPLYIEEAVKWFESKEGDYMVLPLPHPKLLKNVYWWNNGRDGYLGGYPFYYLSSKRFLGIDTYTKGTLSSLISNIYKENLRESEQLNIFNIKYILLHDDINLAYLDNDESVLYSKRGKVKSILNSLNGLVLIKEFGPLSLYENTRWKPTLFYCGGNNIPILDVIKNDISIDYCSSVIKRYQMIIPTKYVLDIETEKPTRIVFNDLYNRHWEMKAGSQKYKSQPYNEIFNSFVIDKPGNQKVTLEYSPQNVFNFGLIISGVTLLLCVLYLGFSYRKK